MNERPESVTVVSWILLVFSGFGYLGCLMTWALRDVPLMQQMLAHSRLPMTTLVWIGVLGVTVRTLCAVGFLMRVGWARHVYLAWAVVMLGYAYWINPYPFHYYPLLLLPNLAFTLAVGVVLFLPANHRWFAGER